MEPLVPNSIAPAQLSLVQVQVHVRVIVLLTVLRQHTSKSYSVLYFRVNKQKSPLRESFSPFPTNCNTEKPRIFRRQSTMLWDWDIWRKSVCHFRVHVLRTLSLRSPLSPNRYGTNVRRSWLNVLWQRSRKNDETLKLPPVSPWYFSTIGTLRE